MRITYICPNLRASSLRLQPNRYIFEVIKGLRSVGHEVLVISDVGEEAPDSEALSGASVATLPSVHVFPFQQNKALKATLDAFRPAVILWSIGYSSAWHFSWPRWLSCPVIGVFTAPVYSPAEVLRAGLVEVSRRPRFYGFFLASALAPKYALRSLLNHPKLSAMVVLSDHVRRQLILSGVEGEKLVVIPPGVEHIPASPGRSTTARSEEAGEIHALYLGSPQTYRGPDTALMAMSLLRKQGHVVRLTILSRRWSGEFDREERYLRNLVQRLELADCVRIVSGYLSFEELQEYYKQSDVILLPFKIVASEMPLTVLEGMQRARPVIATNLSSLPDLLADGRGVVIPPNDSRSLASAIRTLMNSPELRLSMGERAKKFIQSWPTWEATGAAFEQLIVEVVGQGAPQKSEHIYEVSNAKLLRPILRTKAGALLIHWMFQGLLNMDGTERAFKLGLDLIGTILFLALFVNFLPWPLALAVALLLAHSVNFLLNAQPWTVLKHFGVRYYSESDLLAYAAQLGQRCARCASISAVGIWGGFARREHADPGSSDLDVRVIRAPGFFHGFSSCLFVLSERARANWKRFPLDIYLLDGVESLSRLRQTEVPLLLLDREQQLKEIYPTAKALGRGEPSG